MISAVFGQEQSTLTVVLFCVLMSIRFVDFGYRVRQRIIGLGLDLLLLLFSPQLAAVLPSGWKFICHFCSLLMIFLLTSYNRELGNPNLYSFCYVFLVGTVPSKEFFVSRFALVFLAFILFSWIYFRKHREKHQEFTLYKRIVGERVWSENNQSLMVLALGISLFLLWMDIYSLERYMWAGFACASLLSGDRDALKQRAFDRLIGVILGSVGFFTLMSFLPNRSLFLIGPIGGFGLGLFTTYRNQTILNCFGALILAQDRYGIGGSVQLRIWINVIGLLFVGIYLLSLKVLSLLYNQLKRRKLRQNNC